MTASWHSGEPADGPAEVRVGRPTRAAAVALQQGLIAPRVAAVALQKALLHLTLQKALLHLASQPLCCDKALLQLVSQLLRCNKAVLHLVSQALRCNEALLRLASQPLHCNKALLQQGLIAPCAVAVAQGADGESPQRLRSLRITWRHRLCAEVCAVLYLNYERLTQPLGVRIFRPPNSRRSRCTASQPLRARLCARCR